MTYRDLPLFLLLFLFFNCTKMDETRYFVHKIKSNQLKIDGKGNDPLWAKATVLDTFSYPWRQETPPQTIFKALWDETHLYLLYWAADDQIIAKEEGLGEKDVVNSDRVEIFFKSDDKMNPYYSLELDALGRILDTKGIFYRKIDLDWSWPENELVVKSSIEEEGYWVEVAISLASLEQLGMYNPESPKIQAGLYRGEYNKADNGDPEVKWISWITPDSPHPDFHIPSSFGTLYLEQ